MTSEISAVRGLLDQVWFLELYEARRIDRLIRRPVAYGENELAARAWSLGSDQDNARIVAATRRRTDLIVRQRVVGDDPPPVAG